MLGRAVCEELARRHGESTYTAPSHAALDLLDHNAVLDWFTAHRPAAVIHLAGHVRGLAANMGAQIEGLTANARMALNVIEACDLVPPDRLVVAGSTAAYGFPYARLPLDENDLFTGDVHPGEYGYAWGQRTLIAGAMALAQERGIDVTVALLTNLFGPGDRFHGDAAHSVPALIARCVRAADDGAAEIVVWGSPGTTRDFMFAGDAAVAIVAILDAERAPMLMNVASGEERTMADVVQTIANASGFNGRITWDDTKPVGIPRRAVDISRLRQLAVPPPTGFDDGVAQTVQWYRENRHHTH